MLLTFSKIAGQLFLLCASIWMSKIALCLVSHYTFLAGISQNWCCVLLIASVTACVRQDGPIKIFHPTCYSYNALLTLLLSRGFCVLFPRTGGPVATESLLLYILKSQVITGNTTSSWLVWDTHSWTQSPCLGEAERRKTWPSVGVLSDSHSWDPRRLRALTSNVPIMFFVGEQVFS